MDKTYVYPYSYNEAKRGGETELFQCRESQKANCECKRAIEKAIAENFDGYHLNHDVAKGVIAEFGHDRVRFVLANTLKQLDHDGRFSNENKAWAKEFHITPDKVNGRDFRGDFVVGSHPAVLDGFKVRVTSAEVTSRSAPAHHTGGTMFPRVPPPAYGVAWMRSGFFVPVPLGEQEGHVGRTESSPTRQTVSGANRTANNAIFAKIASALEDGGMTMT